MIKEIIYFPNAVGYTGIIAGGYHWVLEPEELLDRAWTQFPHLLFTIKQQV